jgi:diguanylate cyclase
MPEAVHRRVSAVTAVAIALFLAESAWVAVGLVHAWTYPIVGWLPLLGGAVLIAYSYRRVSRQPDLPVATRRFWRHLSLTGVVLVLALLSNIHDAFGGPAVSQRIGPLTLGLMGGEMVILLWALWRLPTWQQTRADWIRFGLDTGVLVITCIGLLWHFSLRFAEGWAGQSASMLGICVLVLVGVGTIAKVSFAGTSQLDRWSLRLLCGGMAAAGLSGAAAPLFADRPYLSITMIAVPPTVLAGVLSAERQRRTPATPEPRQPGRRVSLLPYVSIAAMTFTQLSSEAERGGEEFLLAFCVALLTALVVLRQVSALRENRRLLDTVDAHLRQVNDYQQELAHQISHDPLTGIANRASFAGMLAARLEAGESCHVALLDLDDFKVVNDRFGHGMGDALLRAVSRRLHEALRDRDVVARLGGDEFTLLLPDLTDAAAGELLAAAAEAVQQPLPLHGHDVVPRLSIGVTTSRPGDDAEELIRRADVAMHSAKTLGGGRITWFDPIMDRLADADARLADDLRQAIARDELFLHYQPIVELPHGRFAGVESLIRWRHPEHGLVSPGVFIPLAERNGYIVELGRWVLEQVVRQARRWEQVYGEHAPEKVSVNISARQLREPGFPQQVAELLRGSGLTPHRLVVEVTETAVLGTGQALDAVRELHALGIRVALDDFGTGQSSLSLLVDTPVQILKVDKSFVDGVTGTSAQAVIVDGLIGITQGLRIEAVAEGVETADQAFRLHQMGYRLAQGFHFARPMAAEDVEPLLDVSASRKVDNLH